MRTVPTSRRYLLSVRLLGLAVLLSCSAYLSACRTATLVEPDPNQVTLITTTVAGTVVNESGLPMSDAAVTVHGQNTTTDKDGYFIVHNVSVPTDRFVAIAKQSGYFAAAKAELPKENGLSEVKLFMMSHGARKSVSGVTGGTLNLTSTSGTASLKFEPNGIALNGAAFSGDAQVAIKHLDPADPSFASFFAGDEVAARENGDRTSLLSYGVLRVDMRTAGGEALQPAAGKPAEISYPIPASMQATAPATMPLWFFDEQQGMWVEEGVATKQGNTYVGTVQHFTDWNCDVPSNNAAVSGYVRCGTLGIPNVYVRIGQTYTMTDAAGRYQRRVPLGIDIEVVVDPLNNNGIYESDPIVVTGLVALEQRVLGDIQLTQGCPATFTGTLVNSDGNKIPGKIAWLLSNNRVNVVTTLTGDFKIAVEADKSNTLELSSWSCGERKSITEQAPASMEEKSLGNIQICGVEVPVEGDFPISGFDSLQTFISLNRDGSMVAISGSDPVVIVRSTNDGTLISTAAIEGYRLGDVQFSDDGSRYLVSDAYGGPSAHLVSTATGTLIRSHVEVGGAYLLPDGESILGIQYSGNDAKLVQLDAETGTVSRTFTMQLNRGFFWRTKMKLAPDGKTLSIHADSGLMVIDIAEDKVIASPEYPSVGAFAYSLSKFSADGSKVAFSTYPGGQGYRIVVLEVATGTEVSAPNLAPHNHYMSGFDIHPNGNTVVFQRPKSVDWTSPEVVTLANNATMTTLSVTAGPSMFGQFSFSGDGKRLAGLYMDGDKLMLRMWNL